MCNKEIVHHFACVFLLFVSEVIYPSLTAGVNYAAEQGSY